MTAKFHETDVAIYGKAQITEGTPIQPANTDALAATVLEGTVQRETEAFEYLGDSLSRDELTTLKDTFGEITIESFLPHLGALNPALTVAESPYSQFFLSCGGNVTIDGAGIVTVANNVAVNSLLTLDYHKASPEATGGKDKRWRFSDCRGMFDLAFEVGSRIKLNFKYMGNDSDPSMETAVSPDFLNQKFNIASVVRLQNMQGSTIREILGTEPSFTIGNIAESGGTITVDTSSPHGYINEEKVTISGTTNFNETNVTITVVDVDTFTYTSTNSGLAETSGTVIRTVGVPVNMCVNGISAPNFFGFKYDRYLLSCQEGFTKSATPTDVTVTMLEDEVGGTDFDPDANIEKFYEVEFKYGTGDGKYITLFWNKLQLANVKDSKVATYFGKELTLRNIGNSSIIFS